MSAPVALFAYCRPDHVRRTVDALLRNPLAEGTDLVAFSDAARTPDKRAAVDEVRTLLRGVTGFRSVTIRERTENLGLARSIIAGVGEMLATHERVIVLEDDMVTSPHFLRYMNDALDRYADDNRVASIHAYVYPVPQALPETFFLRGADCWGWATWRRAWSLFNPDGAALRAELERRGLTRAFDLEGAYSYSRMLEDQIAGRNDSWAVRWHASAFLAGKLTLYPGRSLVHNIGNDASGTHCGNTTTWDAAVSETPVAVEAIPVEASRDAARAFAAFFTQQWRPSRRARLRRVARDWLPPVVRRWLGRRRVPVGVSFAGDFASWDDARSQCRGYDDAAILERVLDAARAVRAGDAAFERDSVRFDHAEPAWPVLAGLMYAAARDGGRLSVLDFGGSLGSSYFQHRPFVDRLADVRWNVVEQALFVRAGRDHIAHGPLRFHGSIDASIADQRPNVVLLSSVLQYLEDAYATIAKLSATGAYCLVIDRTPISSAALDRLLVQRVPPSIYDAEYPMRVFSERRLLAALAPNWVLQAAVVSAEGVVQADDGFEFTFKGMVLEARL